MSFRLILASGSATRAKMLRDAGLSIETESPRVDEQNIKDTLVAENLSSRDISDALAEAKAAKIAARHSDALVLGCDQILDHDGKLLNKPLTPDEARVQLDRLRGSTHRLFSAAVLYEHGKPVWRQIGIAKLTMRDISDAYLDSYVTRNWPEIGQSVGAYQLEKEGVRLFSHIQGDHFTILGLPLLEFLNFLSVRGTIDA